MAPPPGSDGASPYHPDFPQFNDEVSDVKTEEIELQLEH
jgi:hypothetical protein